jgi:hypothetical protein
MLNRRSRVMPLEPLVSRSSPAWSVFSSEQSCKTAGQMSDAGQIYGPKRGG